MNGGKPTSAATMIQRTTRFGNVEEREDLGSDLQQARRAAAA
jgi:hypothetical protein